FGRTTIGADARATLAFGANGLAIDVSVGTITQLDEDGGVRSAGAGQKMELGVGSIQLVDTGQGPEGGTLDVQLWNEAGKVSLKKKGEPRFSAAKKGAQAVSEGTAFQVAFGSRARLTGPGVSVRLPAGSAGSFDGAKTGED